MVRTLVVLPEFRCGDAFGAATKGANPATFRLWTNWGRAPARWSVVGTTIRKAHVFEACTPERSAIFLGKGVGPDLPITERRSSSAQRAKQKSTGVSGDGRSDPRNHDAPRTLPDLTGIPGNSDGDDRAAFINHASGEQATLKLWKVPMPILDMAKCSSNRGWRHAKTPAQRIGQMAEARRTRVSAIAARLALGGTILALSFPAQCGEPHPILSAVLYSVPGGITDRIMT